MFEVSNQPPPLEPYNLFASDIVLREAVARERAGWAEDGLSALGATLGKPETVQLGFDANKYPPILRTLDRYGHRLDEVDFHPAWHALHGHRAARRPAFEPLGRSEARRACGARRRHLHAQPDRERGLLPARHDLRLGAELAPCAGDRGGMAAEDFRARLRQALPAGAGKIRRAHRHGHDREPGRLGSAHQYDARRACGRRQLPPARPQMVPVGADVRRLPGAGAIGQGPELLPAAALDAGRRSATRSTSCGSRTSSATAPMRRAKWNSTAPMRS